MTVLLSLLTMEALGGDIKPPRRSVELMVEDVIPTDDANVLLLLQPEDHAIVLLQVGQTEAVSIAHRLAEKQRERPFTHDLLDSALFALDARVVQVHIHTLDDHQYHARVTLERGRKRKRRVHLDARATDAAAIAVGHGLPIYMDADLYEQVSVSVGEMIEKLERQSARNP